MGKTNLTISTNSREAVKMTITIANGSETLKVTHSTTQHINKKNNRNNLTELVSVASKNTFTAHTQLRCIIILEMILKCQ